MKHIVQTNKKTIITAALVAISLLAITVFALEKNRAIDLIKDPFYKPSAAELEQRRVDAANKTDKSLPGKEDMVDRTAGVDTSKDTSQIPISDDYSVTISSVTQESGIVSVAASINSASSTSGMCSFTFTKENVKPVVRTTTESSRTCASDIPELEFTATGGWNLEARFFSNDNQAVDTRKVEIK